MLPLAPLLAAAVGLAAPSALLPGTTWRLSLDVGRHEGVGTWMPAQWGAAGERLQIGSLDVQFLDELCTEVDEPRLNGLGPQEDAYRVRVLTTGTCGDDEVLAMDGAWSRVSKKGRGPTEYRLRFFLEFPNGARRGDVDLGEDRVFFTTDGPLDSVGKASRIGVSKSGQLNVKRVRTFLDALKTMGRSPKLQWGEAMYTVGLYTMVPLALGEQAEDR